MISDFIRFDSFAASSARSAHTHLGSNLIGESTADQPFLVLSVDVGEVDPRGRFVGVCHSDCCYFVHAYLYISVVSL
ncbi:MAG: hypothetical protein ACK55Z_37490 [bacterium]